MSTRASRLLRVRGLVADIFPAADLWLICGGLAVALFLSWLF